MVSRKSRQPVVPAVFLDRDGTMNEEVGYLASAGQVSLLPGVAEAIGELNRCGVKAVVLTNQSGVGRGYFGEDVLAEVHSRLTTLVAATGARVDAIYYCPHLPDQDCSCRKPRTGMLDRAAAELSIDLRKAYVVGDRMKDIEMGRNAGLKAVLVLTGCGERERSQTVSCSPDYIAKDLRDAVGWILADLRQSGRGVKKGYPAP